MTMTMTGGTSTSTVKSSSFSLLPVWISDDTLDPVWVEQATGFQNIQQCVAEDISNQARRGDIIKHGATLKLSIIFSSRKNAKNDQTDDDDNDKDKVEDTMTLVMKQVPPAGLALSRQLGLAREALFYKHLAPKVFASADQGSNDIPKIYYSHGNMETGDKVVIMEDLGGRQKQKKIINHPKYDDDDKRNDGQTVDTEDEYFYLDSGILFGDANPNNWKRNMKEKLEQAYPNSFDKKATRANNKLPPSPFEVAEATFLAMAKVHGTFWQSTDLLTQPSSPSTSSLPSSVSATTNSDNNSDKHFLRGASWIQGKEKHTWEASQGLIQGIWKEKLLPIEEKLDARLKWDPLVKATLIKAMEGISWERQMERLHTTTMTTTTTTTTTRTATTKPCHFTLVHGDCWPGNVLISNKDHYNLRVLDWEMCGIGSGPQDLGQYMISHLNPQERTLHPGEEERVVRVYYDELIRCMKKTMDDRRQGDERNKNQGEGDDVEISFSWEECWREYKVGGVERWLWFLVYFCGQDETIEETTSQTKEGNDKADGSDAATTATERVPAPLAGWAQFFHDQIAAFLHHHQMGPDDVVQPRP